MRKSPRQRRLEADFRSVRKLDDESSIFSFLASGEPPNRYRLLFEGPGISRDASGKIQVVNKHEVIVELGASYPRMVPNLLWQTPIFHPNISNNGVVCLGGYGTHWVPSLTLDEMSTMLWEMIRYRNFDIQSPYNREAALWARDQKKYSFPLDDRHIRDLVNNPEPSNRQTEVLAEIEEPKTPSRKRMMGVFGALASRFRDRSNLEGAIAAQEVAAESVASRAESPEDTVREEDSQSSEQSNNLVDPAEVEVVEEGIAFVDEVRNNGVAATNNATNNGVAATNNGVAAANDEDTGIVFLD